MPTVQVARFGAQAYPVTESVEVMRTPPTRPYVEVAELSYRLNNRPLGEAIERFRAAARELGADAVILGPESARGAVMAPVGGMLMAVPIRNITATAIKFK